MLARQHHGVFHRCVEITQANLWRVWPGGLEEISHNAINLRDFQTNVFDDGARGTGGRQIAADDFDDARDSGKRVANLIFGNSCGKSDLDCLNHSRQSGRLRFLPGALRGRF